jgi:hypothetical protein
MQFAAILAPYKLEQNRVADILMKNGFQLVSKEPLSSYDSRDIKINLFVDFQSWDTILSSYEVYRVVGPEKRRTLFKFENTPLWVKWRYYAFLNVETVIERIKYYFAKPKSNTSV